MDSTSQQTVVGLDLTNFIRGIARNSEITHNAPTSATNENGFLREPQEGNATLLKFGGEGETEDESVVVSDSEEVGEARGRAPTVIEFDTEIFIENVTMLMEHLFGIIQRQEHEVKCMETALFFV